MSYLNQSITSEFAFHSPTDVIEKFLLKKNLQNILVEIVIVRPESPVRDMKSQMALGQTKYQEALHVAFLGLCILKRHRKL